MQVLSRHWSYFKICSEIYFDSNLFPAEQMSDNIISHRVVWSDRVTDSVVAQRFDQSDKGGGTALMPQEELSCEEGGEAPVKIATVQPLYSPDWY